MTQEPIVMEMAVRESFNFQIEKFVRKVIPDYGPTAYLKLSFLLYPTKTLFDSDHSYIIEITDTSFLQTPAMLKIEPGSVNLGTPYPNRQLVRSTPMKAHINYSIDNINDVVIKETESIDQIIIDLCK